MEKLFRCGSFRKHNLLNDSKLINNECHCTFLRPSISIFFSRTMSSERVRFPSNWKSTFYCFPIGARKVDFNIFSVLSCRSGMQLSLCNWKKVAIKNFTLVLSLYIKQNHILFSSEVELFVV